MVLHIITNIHDNSHSTEHLISNAVKMIFHAVMYEGRHMQSSIVYKLLTVLVTGKVYVTSLFRFGELCAFKL